MSTAEQDIKDLIAKHGLEGNRLKDFFKQAVRENWPGLPSWSTLTNGPVIQEVETATLGCGAVVVLNIEGERYVLMGQAGPHCEHEFKKKKGNENAEFPVCYAIPGGFGNLTITEGSSQVHSNDQPENGFMAIARETEEEFPNADGTPLISINPDDVILQDTLTLSFGPNNKRIVMGGLYETTAEQTQTVIDHVKRMETDADYKEQVASHTLNKDTGLAEVSDNKLFKLSDLADGKIPLYHPDQLSLFQKVQKYYQSHEIIKARVGPTLEAQQKVMNLEQLKAQVEQWRTIGNATIGITSGTYDFVHNGHTSFLNHASKECSRLIVVVASDRTTGEAKPGKPVNGEQDRAEFLAEFGSVDAVIISDEKYHETILKAIEPDMMFKGDEYKGQKIHGAELVRHGVMFIECAQFVHKHSSAYLDHIWEKKPLKGPAPTT